MENEKEVRHDESPALAQDATAENIIPNLVSSDVLPAISLNSDDTPNVTTESENNDNKIKEDHGVNRQSSDTQENLSATQTSSTTLFIESEQKLKENGSWNETDGMADTRQTPSERPMSAGRQRTSIVEEAVTSMSSNLQQDITNFRNIVTFDTDVKNAYPERTDSETNLIIQHLKEVTALVNDDDKSNENADDETFTTSLSEEYLEEARRRQERRRAEREAMIWKDDSSAMRLTMKEVIDAKVHQHYSKGIIQTNEGQFESAVASFTKGINLQAHDLSCYVERGEAYLQLCDFRSAYLNYKKAHSLEPHNPHIFDKLAFVSCLEGQCLFDQALYSEALECFTRAAEMKPASQSYHMRAITCLAALGRHQECLALVTRRLESETTGNPELYVLRARLHLQFGNVTLCYYDVRDALSLNSELPQALTMMKEIREKATTAKQLAVQLTVQGRLNEALNKMRTAVETDPSVAEYHVFRGALHRRMESFNEAIDDYLLAMDKSDHDENNPTYKSAQRQLLLTYNDFAVHCYNKGFYEEAVILLNKAVKGEKNEKGLYVNRGDCFFKLNDLHFALADYQQALEIDPTCWGTKCRVSVVYNEFGISAYQERLYDEAVRRFTLAIQNNGKVGQFYLHRCRSYYMMQDVENARKDILIALHLDPDNDEMIPLLSRLYPGRSVKEVLRSKPAETARSYIASTVGSHTKLPPTPSSPRKQSGKSVRSMSHTPASALPSPPSSGIDTPSRDALPSKSWKEDDLLTTAETISPAPRKMESDAEMLAKKRSISSDLQNMFRFPKSLKHTGPRIKHNITPQPQVETNSGSGRGYSWRKAGAEIFRA